MTEATCVNCTCITRRPLSAQRQWFRPRHSRQAHCRQAPTAPHQTTHLPTTLRGVAPLQIVRPCPRFRLTGARHAARSLSGPPAPIPNTRTRSPPFAERSARKSSPRPSRECRRSRDPGVRCQAESRRPFHPALSSSSSRRRSYKRERSVRESSEHGGLTVLPVRVLPPGWQGLFEGYCRRSRGNKIRSRLGPGERRVTFCGTECHFLRTRISFCGAECHFDTLPSNFRVNCEARRALSHAGRVCTAGAPLRRTIRKRRLSPPLPAASGRRSAR